MSHIAYGSISQDPAVPTAGHPPFSKLWIKTVDNGSVTNYFAPMTTKRSINGVMGQIGRIRERATLFVEQELKKEGVHGILTAHGSVLIYLFDQDKAVPMKEIVEKVGRVKSTVTGMVNTLEQHGYVEKTQSIEDGRVMLVQLTDKGQAIRPAFDRITNSLLEKIYGDMPQGDRETLVQLLTQVGNNLKK